MRTWPSSEMRRSCRSLICCCMAATSGAAFCEGLVSVCWAQSGIVKRIVMPAQMIEVFIGLSPPCERIRVSPKSCAGRIRIYRIETNPRWRSGILIAITHRHLGQGWRRRADIQVERIEDGSGAHLQAAGKPGAARHGEERNPENESAD